MDFASIWDTTVFLLTHVTAFELPLVLAGTAVAALVLARVLDRHNARTREARLARRVAVAYAGLLIVLIAARIVLR